MKVNHKLALFVCLILRIKLTSNVYYKQSWTLPFTNWWFTTNSRWIWRQIDDCIDCLVETSFSWMFLWKTMSYASNKSCILIKHLACSSFIILSRLNAGRGSPLFTGIHFHYIPQCKLFCGKLLCFNISKSTKSNYVRMFDSQEKNIIY